jgi:hypothetical protein
MLLRAVLAAVPKTRLIWAGAAFSLALGLVLAGFAAGVHVGSERAERSAAALRDRQLNTLRRQAAEDRARVGELTTSLAEANDFYARLRARSLHEPIAVIARQRTPAPAHSAAAGGAPALAAAAAGTGAAAPGHTAAATPASEPAAPPTSAAGEAVVVDLDTRLTHVAVGLWNSALLGAAVGTHACGADGTPRGACAAGTRLGLTDAWLNHQTNAQSCAADRARFAALQERVRAREAGMSGAQP